MKQKRTITIELDRIKITTTRNFSKTQWCEFCRKETEFLGQTEATEVAQAMSQQGLTMNNKTLHIHRQDPTETLICLNSMMTGSDPANQ